MPEVAIIFSALPHPLAGAIERELADKGKLVISNAKSNRMVDSVPILIPEVNSEHLSLLPAQPFKGGKIITQPNCTSTALAQCLKPIIDRILFQKLQH